GDNSGRGTDSRLKDVKADLEQLKYDTFRLAEENKIECAVGQEIKIDLLGKNRLLVQHQGSKGDRIRLAIRLSPAKPSERAVDTVMLVRDGGTFLIGGPAFGKGVLILALTASW
ncbi:MAG: hypothetical protein U9P14_10770, partial [Gemmatimonadota bacterium]|nr:hypothetical protein [Gemmatimonadota bacterium]